MKTTKKTPVLRYVKITVAADFEQHIPATMVDELIADMQDVMKRRQFSDVGVTIRFSVRRQTI